MRKTKHITISHGGGGQASAQLINEVFLPAFKNVFLENLSDGALLPPENSRLAFSTDSYVIDPIFFPGGDIGSLAVHGTVNDVAMCGAEPRYISAGFIIEEGFLIDDLKRIADSMGEAARACGVKIVTGDTKVVARGGADKLFINTAGIGYVPEGVEIGAQRVNEGDAIILSGTIGDHGAAVLTKRKGLDFKTPVESDSQPLNGLVKDMLKVCPDIHMLRDPTRGGLAAALTEIAASSKKGILIDEKAIPVNESVRSICEILGLDVLQIANEGKLVAFVPEEFASKVLDAVRKHPAGKDAAIIGRVSDKTDNVEPGVVEMKTAFIGNRLIEPPTGDMLPRIC